jgi:hypothetical protein
VSIGIYNGLRPDCTSRANESGQMSRVVWRSDGRAQGYPECWAENRLKHPKPVQMRKRLKHLKRPKHLEWVQMENRPKRGFPWHPCRFFSTNLPCCGYAAQFNYTETRCASASLRKAWRLKLEINKNISSNFNDICDRETEDEKDEELRSLVWDWEKILTKTCKMSLPVNHKTE